MLVETSRNSRRTRVSRPRLPQQIPNPQQTHRAARLRLTEDFVRRLIRKQRAVRVPSPRGETRVAACKNPHAAIAHDVHEERRKLIHIRDALKRSDVGGGMNVVQGTFCFPSHISGLLLAVSNDCALPMRADAEHPRGAQFENQKAISRRSAMRRGRRSASAIRAASSESRRSLHAGCASGEAMMPSSWRT